MYHSNLTRSLRSSFLYAASNTLGWVVRCVAVAVLLVPGCCGYWLADFRATVACSIVDIETGNPVAGASVIVRVLSVGEQLGEAIVGSSGENGQFTLDMFLGFFDGHTCLLGPSTPDRTVLGLEPDQVEIVVRTHDMVGEVVVDLRERYLDLESSGRLLITLPSTSVQLAPRLDTVYGVGDFPLAAVALDFDGDGANDLAVVNRDGDSVSVLWNVGDGTFVRGTDVPVGDRPVSVQGADLDGDGDYDLAVASEGDSEITLCLNNGDRSFLTSAGLALDEAPDEVQVADLDGDGNVDLVVLSGYPHGWLHVLFNNGDATFNTSVELDLPGDSARYLQVADLDADGDLDLIIKRVDGDAYVHYVQVLLNAGDGTFGHGAVLPFPSAPCGLLAGDVDGDGDSDLVMSLCYFGDDQLLVQLNDGAGGFPVAKSLPLSGFPIPRALADLDGDGDLDVVIAGVSEYRLDILLNDGSGSFTRDRVFHADSSLPRAIAAELDGVQSADLVVINPDDNSVAVFLNPLDR